MWDRPRQAITRHREYDEESHAPLCGLLDGRVIDGFPGGDSASRPNYACSANYAAVESGGTVYIEAIACIDLGEELFIVYGLTPGRSPLPRKGARPMLADVVLPGRAARFGEAASRAVPGENHPRSPTSSGCLLAGGLQPTELLRLERRCLFEPLRQFGAV